MLDFLFASQAKRGESFTSRRLRSLDNSYYRVIDNIMLPSKGNTHATQIDHIVVSNFGIFCIETKSHEGLVFGNRTSRNWTYIYYKTRTKMYNPLLQNYAHQKAIEDVLEWRLRSPIIPLVVFPNAHVLKVAGTDSVGRIDYLMQKIAKYKQRIYADHQRDDIYETLLNSDITSRKTRRIHKSEVSVLSRRY